MTARYINRLFYMIIAALWLPGIAWAGTITLDATLASVSGVVVSLVFGLSTLGGISSLLYRLKDELIRHDGKLPAWPIIFVSANLVGAWLAGFLAFAICEASTVNAWIEMVSIAVAAFCGGKFIEFVAEKLYPGVGSAVAPNA